MNTQTHIFAGKKDAQSPLLLRPTEAARALAISIRSLDYLRANGQISPIRIGKSVRYPLDEVERFISARRQPHVGRPRNTDSQFTAVQSPTPGTGD